MITICECCGHQIEDTNCAVCPDCGALIIKGDCNDS